MPFIREMSDQSPVAPCEENKSFGYNQFAPDKKALIF